MSYASINQLALGNYLTIAFVEGVHKQISITYPEWEMVERMKVGSVDGREARFLLQRSLGPSAIQYRNPGVRSDFPAGQESSITEGTITYKELDATIELEYNLYRRILESKSKYDASALAMETDAKITALKRQMCIDFYGDGSGCLGRVASVSISGGQAVVTLRSLSTDQGFAGAFQFDEKVKHYAAVGSAGSSVTVSSGTFDHWAVVARDPRSTVNTVTLEARDSSDAALVATAWSPTAGEAFYKVGQPTIPDLTSTATDLGSQTEVIIGLDGLIRNDGRLVHGIAQKGAVSGQVIDGNGNVVDTNLLEAAMNQVKNAVGEGRYRWPMLLCNREVRSAFIDSRETDRRFISIEDNKRGLNKFVYVHQDDSIELKGSEFCPVTKSYLVPEGKTEGQKVLQFRGTEFKPARAENGDVFMFAPGTSGYHKRLMVSYMSGMGQLLNLHPAGCVKITNYTV